LLSSWHFCFDIIANPSVKNSSHKDYLKLKIYTQLSKYLLRQSNTETTEVWAEAIDYQLVDFAREENLGMITRNQESHLANPLVAIRSGLNDLE